MTTARAMLVYASLGVLLCCRAAGQDQNAWEFESLTDQGRLDYNFQTGVAVGTNGVLIRYGGAVLTADSVVANQETGEVSAQGRVRIQRDDQVWAGDAIRYNFKTRQMTVAQFRTGRPPVFAAAQGLRGDPTNATYTATNAFVTTDDFSEPFERIQASRITIVPGQYVEMRNAVLFLGSVPVFYFPYYKRSLEARGNQFNVVPGYRSRFGGFLLGSYTWLLNDRLDGVVHLDYRTKRGVGAGPEFNAHLGRWGEASLRYYYAADQAPGEDLTGRPVPDHRQRLHFAYLATPFTNVTFRSQVRYLSDPRVEHDFFESEYRQNRQPTSFFEVTRFWDNFALDVFTQPRVNDFFDTVERLPEVKLTGWRQQLGATPLYYESESAAGFYRRRYGETNGVTEPAFEAFRGDTYHQVVLPRTLFGWLNVTPRIGGRFTQYSEADGAGATTVERSRGVFNTGAEVSFKAWRLWPGVTNRLLQLDGLRHVVEPSFNYVFVPDPSQPPSRLPQFDPELPSLRLLPIEYPDYNAVDAVDARNVLRLGLRNSLQTKRQGRLENVVEWALFTDWRLDRQTGQDTFSDLYSELTLRPRSWLSLSSEVRYDVADGRWQMAFHTLTLQPTDVWSWSLGHYYLRDDRRADPTAWGEGNELATSTLFFRLDENWGLRTTHYFDVRRSRLQEQYYTLYRDFRSWTGALTFRAQEDRRGTRDYTVAVSFSLKAAPKYHVGEDVVRPYGLIGR